MSGQPGGDDDQITQQRGRRRSGPAEAGVAFHRGQRQQQVAGLAADSGRTAGPKQLIGRADHTGHRHRQSSHRITPDLELINQPGSQDRWGYVPAGLAGGWPSPRVVSTAGSWRHRRGPAQPASRAEGPVSSGTNGPRGAGSCSSTPACTRPRRRCSTPSAPGPPTRAGTRYLPTVTLTTCSVGVAGRADAHTDEAGARLDEIVHAVRPSADLVACCRLRPKVPLRGPDRQ